MEAVYVVMYRSRLAQSLQLLPCLLLFYDGGEGRSNFPSEFPPIRPGCPVTCADTSLLRPEPAASTLFQPSTSDIDPLVWSRDVPLAKNPSTGTAQQRLFLVLKVVLHAVVVISEVLRLSTKSRCSRCCRHISSLECMRTTLASSQSFQAGLGQ